MTVKAVRIVLALLLLPTAAAWNCAPLPGLDLPRSSLEPADLAVVVDTNDLSSIFLGHLYAFARGIPEENIVEVAIPPDELRLEGRSLTATGFGEVIAEVHEQVDASIQAYALAWTYPYRVHDCMSITAAFAIGAYDETYCDPDPASTCNTATTRSDYFGSLSVRPFTDFGIRPAMMLAGETVADALKVLVNGLLADGTDPGGTAYLVRTTDFRRSNPRLESFVQTEAFWDAEFAGLEIEFVDNGQPGSSPADDHLLGAEDLFVYMTGLTSVEHLETHDWLPGAVADHLTSFGGRLEGGGQMSILRWLEAGATASYGTMAEPCAVTSKFPDPDYLLTHYVRGNTLIEAYWKSVARFGEGVFVGEPLARPFGTKTSIVDGDFVIETTILQPSRTYELRGYDPALDAWVTVLPDIQYAGPRRVLVAPAPLHPRYALVHVEAGQ